MRLVVELSAATTAYSIQVLVALDGATLDRLYRTGSTLTVSLRTLTAATRRRSQATAINGRAVATISGLSVVWSSAVVESMSASSHGSGTVIVSGVGVPGTAHSRVEYGCHVHTILRSIASCHVHIHVSQVESSRCPGSLDMVTHWKVAVAVRVAAGRGDVCGIDDIAVDKSEL